MSEALVYGRQPATIIEIDIDRCSSVWSRGTCSAGRWNQYVDSESFGNASRWNIGNFTSSLETRDVELPSTDGTQRRLELTANGSASITPVDVMGNLPNEGILYHNAFFKADTNIDEVRFNIFHAPFAYEISLDITTGETTMISSADFDYVDVQQYGDWYRLSVGLDISKRTGISSGPTWTFYDDGGTPLSGSVVYVHGLQATPVKDSLYFQSTSAKVTGTAINKCFNTRSTCDDKENYTRSTQTLRFCEKHVTLTDAEYLPFLESVSLSPGEINLGGANASQSPFGKRSVLKVIFSDHPHDDTGQDDYIISRDYDPLERGTFWSKWFARNDFFIKRPIRRISGYIKDGALVDTVTNEFFISTRSGPSNSNRVEITGKDVLFLAEDKKAQAPLQNSGTLLAGITAGAGTATLTPSGIGDSEYSASGKIRINSEIMDFTRSGDTLTLSLRGTDGTTADEHDAGDNVQECLVYTSQKPQDIYYDLLNVYAGIDASNLNKSQWDTEQLSHLPSLYSTVISEPTSVNALCAECMEQMQFTSWYDERDSLVYIRATRTAQDEEITDLNDCDHLLKNSANWDDKPEQLLTRVWVYFGQKNRAEKLDEVSNYTSVIVDLNLDAESEDEHNTKQIKKIFSRWINSGGGGTASLLASTFLEFFGNIPKVCEFKLDAKDRDLWLGDFIRITNRNRVDEFGLPVPVSMQISRVAEIEVGSVFAYLANEYRQYERELVASDRPVIISANLLNVNLYDLYVEQYGAPTGTENIIFTIKSGVTVGGDSANYTEVNLAEAARSASNDFYDPGTTQTDSIDLDDIRILQRQGLGTLTDTAAGAAYSNSDYSYHDGGLADFKIRECPAMTSIVVGSGWTTETLTLVIESGAKLLGEGGNGSMHALQTYAIAYKSGGSETTDFLLGVPGGDGGHAIDASDYPISILNDGIIAGGGGGGGGTVYYPDRFSSSRFWDSFFTVSGAGGGGSLNGKAHLYQTTQNAADMAIFKAEGQDGTDTFRGLHGTQVYLVPDSFLNANRFQTGTGGDLAEDGYFTRIMWRDGSEEYSPELVLGNYGPADYIAFPGGKAGAAVAAGSGNITWLTKGDVRGAENA